MPEGQVRYVKNNFSAGELSPLMDARLDVDKYSQGVSTAENVVLLPQGGFTFAWGTEFVAEVKFSNRKTRAERFRFSTEQAYALEVGHGYFRFYRNQGQIGGVITNVGNDGSGGISVLSPGHTLSNGDTIYVSGVNGTTEANGFWTVTNATTDVFGLSGSTYLNGYLGGGKWVAEIASPYDEADLFDLQFIQSADVVYIVHESYATRKLSRMSHTTWKLESISWTGGPFRPKDPAVTTTITPSVTTGSGTLTASAALFTSGHVNALWEITHGSTTGYVRITGFTSSTSVNMTVVKTLGATTAATVWREGMWSVERGFPRAACINEERLVLGGSPDDPSTFVGSVTGNYEDMTVGTNDDDAYQYTIGASEVCTILWMASGDPMLLGTPSGVFKAFGGNATKSAITPSSIAVRLQTSVGAAPILPVTVENDLFYLQNSRKKLRRLQYSLEADKFVAEDVTVLASHILSQRGGQMAYQAEPYDLLWIVRGDGQLVLLTTMEQQKIRGFTRRKPVALGSVQYESVTCIPEPDEEFDQPWTIVKRTINGQTKRYMEYVTVTDPLDPDRYSYLESALTYEGAATSSVSGLDHLPSTGTVIVADGKYLGQAAVTNGTVTLPTGITASKIRVGYPLVGWVTTNKPEVQLPDGPSTSRKRKLAEVKLRFVNTIGAAVVSGVSVGEELPFLEADGSMDVAPPLFTGEKPFDGTSYEDDGVLTILQIYPLPMTITNLSGSLMVGET